MVYGYADFPAESLSGKLLNLIFLVSSALESTTGKKSFADSAEVNSVSCDIFWSAIIFFNYTTLNLNYGSLQSKACIHFRVGYGYERVILAQEV